MSTKPRPQWIDPKTSFEAKTMKHKTLERLETSTCWQPTAIQAKKIQEFSQVRKLV